MLIKLYLRDVDPKTQLLTSPKFKKILENTLARDSLYRRHIRQ